MATDALRQLLNNLCTNSQWCYAVFWKLQQLDNHKILTCEEVYYDSEKSQQPCQSILSEPYTMQEVLTSFGFGTNVTCDAPSLEYPIASAVADISCCQYLLGEGMVGRVALAENDFWIYSDDIESTELISNLEYGDEWFLPIISAGMKHLTLIVHAVERIFKGYAAQRTRPTCGAVPTTLLASVLPYGVVQLGSFEKVAENQVLSADIRERFYSLNSTTINPSSNYDDDLLLHSILIPEPEHTDESGFCYSSSLQRLEYEDATTIHTPEFIQNTDFHFPTVYDQLVPFMDNEKNLDMEDLSFFIDDQYIHHPNFDMANVESDTVPNEFITADHTSEETEMWIHELQRALGPDFSRDCYELQQEAFQSAFPKDSELQEAIIKTNNDRHLYKDNAFSTVCFDSLKMETCGLFFEEGDEKELLVENMVSATTSTSTTTTTTTTTTNNNSDDTDVFYQCNTSKSSVTSLTEHATCDATNTAVLAHESVIANCLPSPPSLESLESATVQHEQPPYEKNIKPKAIPSKRGKETPKSKNRPRPRDRQLIQDRLKELRNLIPDSEKCSIDGLLDQTMKHMTFLKSVTERAEKVKHFIGEEVDSSTNCQKNDSHPSFALDSNYEACPIIMKDLEHPSQFLIQMICSDEGVFFEIAEVMHKLKLTILKGVMENRRNKWACFIVEASKGFNRLDIFWPLMRILQQQGNWLITDKC